MDYSLLKAQSTFSLEDIFLIYLKIDISRYKTMAGKNGWLSEPHENYDWDEKHPRTELVYCMKNYMLDRHSELTEIKYKEACALYSSLKHDCQNKLLEVSSENSETGEFFISRENIHQWFMEHRFEWPDELKPFNFDSELESAKDKIKEKDELIQELMNKVEKNIVPEKWRQAFEYESEGLNALYDLIEKYYFDDAGNPVYDTKDLPLKKNIESDWLAVRTLAEADTIITSGKRKGVNDK